MVFYGDKPVRTQESRLHISGSLADLSHRGNPTRCSTGDTQSSTSLDGCTGHWLSDVTADKHWIKAATRLPLGGARSIH